MSVLVRLPPALLAACGGGCAERIYCKGADSVRDTAEPMRGAVTHRCIVWRMSLQVLIELCSGGEGGLAEASVATAAEMQGLGPSRDPSHAPCRSGASCA
jgi:hypothetical protein